MKKALKTVLSVFSILAILPLAAITADAMSMEYSYSTQYSYNSPEVQMTGSFSKIKFRSTPCCAYSVAGVKENLQIERTFWWSTINDEQAYYSLGTQHTSWWYANESGETYRNKIIPFNNTQYYSNDTYQVWWVFSESCSLFTSN